MLRYSLQQKNYKTHHKMSLCKKSYHWDAIQQIYGQELMNMLEEGKEIDGFLKECREFINVKKQFQKSEFSKEKNNLFSSSLSFDQGLFGENKRPFGGNQGLFGGNHQGLFGGNQGLFGGNQGLFGGNQGLFGGNQGEIFSNKNIFGPMSDEKTKSLFPQSLFSSKENEEQEKQQTKKQKKEGEEQNDEETSVIKLVCRIDPWGKSKITKVRLDNGIEISTEEREVDFHKIKGNLTKEVMTICPGSVFKKDKQEYVFLGISKGDFVIKTRTEDQKIITVSQDFFQDVALV